MILRDYQEKMIESVRNSIRKGNKSVILHAATGVGKTIIAAAIISSAIEKGKKVLFLVHYRQLAHQAIERFEEFGIGDEVGTIMAGEETHLSRPVQVASIQTYSRRLNLDESGYNPWFHKADLVIYDECLSPDTEILTTNGWKLIKDINKEKDYVAQYNQLTKEISFTLPGKKISKYHNGYLYRFHTQKYKMDLLGTPNHEQPLQSSINGEFKKYTFEEWNASDNQYIPISGYKYGVCGITPEDRFQIMASADGYFTGKKSIQFQFKKQRKIDRFFDIVKQCGYKYTENKSCTNINGSTKRRFLVSCVKNKKGLKHTREIDKINHIFAKEFIKELIEWDGSKKNNQLYWSGTNIEDADYIQSVCVLGGIRASRYKQEDNRKETYKTVHRMNFIITDKVGCQAVKKEKVKYSGMVYCVEVPDGNIIIRRNNRVMITGNCHASLAKTRKAVLDFYKQGSIILGLSASPSRADGRPLGDIYDDIVSCVGINELTDQGYLVPAVYYGCKELPDLKDIPTVLGDYDKKILGKRVDKPKLIGDIYNNWCRICIDRQTVIFATNVKHSMHIKEFFENSGIAIEHVDAYTTQEDRIDILNRFKNGDIQVVTNVGVFSEGADFPYVSCIVLARPSKSYGRYIQMAGRGLRPHPEKKDCIFIDHAGIINRHGFLEDEVEWTLSGKDKAWKKKVNRKKEKKIFQCDECTTLFSGSRCSLCGWEIKGWSKKIATTDDEFVELGKTKKPKPTMAEKQRFYQMLEYHRREKGYKEGWLGWTFKFRFKTWPRGFKDLSPIEPDANFKKWITYMNIRKAKSKKRVDNDSQVIV